MIEKTQFLSTVSLCSKFKLGNIIIYSEVNFCRKNVCGKFARNYFGRLLKNRNTRWLRCSCIRVVRVYII